MHRFPLLLDRLHETELFYFKKKYFSIVITMSIYRSQVVVTLNIQIGFVSGFVLDDNLFNFKILHYLSTVFDLVRN